MKIVSYGHIKPESVVCTGCGADKVPTMKRCPNREARMTGAREVGTDGAGAGCEADKEDMWK